LIYLHYNDDDDENDKYSGAFVKMMKMMMKTRIDKSLSAGWTLRWKCKCRKWQQQELGAYVQSFPKITRCW